MKHVILFVVATIFIAPGFDTSAQNYDARMNALLAEIDGSEIELKLNQLASAAAATLTRFQLTRTAILPFRNEADQRTGLTEFIAAEFTKKLRLRQTGEIISAEQVSTILRNQKDLATVRWPGDGPDLAIRLGTRALIRGQLDCAASEMSLSLEIYSLESNQILGTHQTRFPRTAGMARLHDLVLDETPVQLPQPLPPGSIQPESRPAPPPSVTPVPVVSTLEIAIRNLAAKLARDAAQPVKIGVLEFLDLQGRITQLGKFIAEDLTTAFFEKGQFSLVERGLLQQITREHALAQTGMLDLDQAREIGKLVGADAIITGSLSDLGPEIKANARLIAVREGTVLSVAGESFAKTENVNKMFGTILWSPENKRLELPPAVTPSAPTGTGFFEDFQNVPEGMLPEGWFGGEKLLVKTDGQQKFVTDFEWQDTHKVLIDNVSFPENFEFTVYFQFGRQADHTRLVALLGSLTLTVDVFGWYKLNQTRVEKHTDWRNQMVKVVLTRSGPIFKLFINGEEVLVLRDTEYKLPQAISLEFQKMSGFRLVQVGVTGR